MPAKINLLNQRFGKLLVVEETQKRKNKSVVWKCLCDCGNIVEYSTKELRSDGLIQCPNCGHDRSPTINLTPNIIGQKFNHLTVLEKTQNTSFGKLLYKCECDCLDKTIVYATRTSLINNEVTSCGCRKRKYQIGDIINNRQILDYVYKSNERMYYKCKCLLCGNEYETLSFNIQKTISCGCVKSIGEYNIIQVLLNNNIKYLSQYSFPNSQYRYDFAILNQNNEVIRLIEFDGEQHYEKNIKNSGWNTYDKYLITFEHDQQKNILAQQNNIPLIRIPYWERDSISINLIMKDKYLVL